MVTLWTLAPPDLPVPAWQTLADCLDRQERDRAARFRFAADRHAYVAAHGLLRHALSQCAERPPTSWRFAAAPHGKPVLAEPLPGRDLRFSLSHSRGLVAVAITEGADVGVDVEALDGEHGDLLSVADQFFAPEEYDALRALPNETARRERFITLWTLKEACLKAAGLGLSLPLDSVSFPVVRPPRPTIRAPVLGDPGTWWLRTLVIRRHRLAVCTRTPPHVGTVTRQSLRRESFRGGGRESDAPVGGPLQKLRVVAYQKNGAAAFAGDVDQQRHGLLLGYQIEA